MSVLRITKTFYFEMAHALDNHDGKCKNIHGHSYQLDVTLRGKAIEDKSDPKVGMVMDFGDLKKIVKAKIINKLDHALLLWQDSPFLNAIDPGLQEKLVVIPWHPTSENILVYIASILQPEIPEGVELYSLKLFETPTSSATWYSEDQG